MRLIIKFAGALWPGQISEFWVEINSRCGHVHLMSPREAAWTRRQYRFLSLHCGSWTSSPLHGIAELHLTALACILLWHFPYAIPYSKKIFIKLTSRQICGALNLELVISWLLFSTPCSTVCQLCLLFGSILNSPRYMHSEVDLY